MIKDLIKLADALDNEGLHEDARLVDSLINKLAKENDLFEEKKDQLNKE